MAHFQLEQELQAALKLDSTINFNTSSALNRSSRQNTKENGSAKKRAASANQNLVGEVKDETFEIIESYEMSDPTN